MFFRRHWFHPITLIFVWDICDLTIVWSDQIRGTVSLRTQTYFWSSGFSPPGWRPQICVRRLRFYLSWCFKTSSCPTNGNSLINPRASRRLIDKALCLCRYSAKALFISLVYATSVHSNFRAFLLAPVTRLFCFGTRINRSSLFNSDSFGGTETFCRRRKQLYQWVPRTQ